LSGRRRRGCGPIDANTTTNNIRVDIGETCTVNTGIIAAANFSVSGTLIVSGTVTGNIGAASKVILDGGIVNGNVKLKTAGGELEVTDNDGTINGNLSLPNGGTLTGGGGDILTINGDAKCGVAPTDNLDEAVVFGPKKNANGDGEDKGGVCGI